MLINNQQNVKTQSLGYYVSASSLLTNSPSFVRCDYSNVDSCSLHCGELLLQTSASNYATLKQHNTTRRSIATLNNAQQRDPQRSTTKECKTPQRNATQQNTAKRTNAKQRKAKQHTITQNTATLNNAKHNDPTQKGQNTEGPD